MYQTLLINIDELFMKGKNRGRFLLKLKEHILYTTKKYHQDEVNCYQEYHRYIIESEKAFEEKIIDKLAKIPGINSIYLSHKVPCLFDYILPKIIDELNNHCIEIKEKKPLSFKVITQRANKQFPIGSMDVSSQIGHEILQKFPQLHVKMKNPELKIFIRILQDGIYISTKNKKAIGGLPVGTNGHLLSLLSGGIDSPVASFLMSKRGCRLSYIFFYAYPFVGEEVKDKITKLAKILSDFQMMSTLYIVPFGNVQKEISRLSRKSYRTLFIRKAMIECSSKLAEKIKANGLVTGDSMGQVASQTLPAMALLQKCSTLPFFSPLIGLNKQEIIDFAKKIDTFKTSILPHDDACSLFAPQHPTLNPQAEYWEEFSMKYDFTKIYDEALNNIEVIKL